MPIVKATAFTLLGMLILALILLVPVLFALLKVLLILVGVETILGIIFWNAWRYVVRS